MGKVTGFLEVDRQDRKYRPAADRIRNFKEFVIPLPEQVIKDQASRCMECGIPFCHDVKGLKGCPVNNQIPDWNDLVYKGDWEQASRDLHSTNNFPEFTGRICPAPCEASCTLNIIDEPVTIKSIECAIVDRAWKNNWIQPEINQNKTGKIISVIGSGPAGLAASQQLARAGHNVNLYEKNEKAGGLLRYGIPDFKMEKFHIDRRVEQMSKEGVVFHTGVKVGTDIAVDKIIEKSDAVILAGGAEKPRDLEISGRDLDGVHFAMEFLPQQNRRVSAETTIANSLPILANGKHVVVIGGGDTGSDCIGTSIRQGALSVTQLEIMPKPPERENKFLTWPNWPLKMRTSSSQEEGAEREFSVMTDKFTGKNGSVSQLHCIRVDEKFSPIKGSEFSLKADLVLLAMGF
ncbi:MAG: glutamate synthase subunit beta, partial [Pseudomonadota bacterium]|nr:glutamate synthase subunit beta [Pseudomonadota bacterium]